MHLLMVVFRWLMGRLPVASRGDGVKFVPLAVWPYGVTQSYGLTTAWEFLMRKFHALGASDVGWIRVRPVLEEFLGPPGHARSGPFVAERRGPCERRLSTHPNHVLQPREPVLVGGGRMSSSPFLFWG